MSERIRNEELADVWRRTVVAIGNFDVTPEPAKTLRPPRPARRSARPAACWDGRSEPTVRVLDKPTAQTLTVSWCDARTGHYGYQTWRVNIARRAGQCVLTGRSIRAGETVYCPRANGTPPGNAGAMIVASGVDI
ncbi:DUF3331 domain-containing protein [Paraburkholderia caribensis]|jgi:hypothetical protein|uniref:DUF3331 domain-containing protein n=1 Tax=Paraburkholderia caribensis TaxID=75105 RepID=UPI00071FF4B3|nr:DUF3331 domain-containing protein [Paraburkholderia caribensis]ALP67315.1 hypothetical protein AN416_32065 [Paraburkholderia caribensis]AUT57033.1 DUF3331 domain-containing protein [Paraburkholderia caribensis]MDR6381105.1 hypothetical protein [Paraburkholderia caribensis]